ncbi:probable G-protein coupled receptor CG31760 isoform X2 [Daktulosphaira vitifoliae]|nr:probable G-protein coupled receptor CG31760 isoform X2 [Daktulosphaira vitifoliae]XP_050523396.1 probable G-protein coupled receptor CG31760 isoform X2 [Daktulosphaira vitifoliae]XP_050523397.1 probable G-protein coupled receptor CG31760 isoform X2 [Daktulosphaira vitifoliae]XP_050523398.1 probable G-protein coupled receptor CG31760 isoform X2 [Daktulosphaira vitifoliae]
MLTRLWKYAGHEVMNSEYLLHAGVISMVEFDDDIFAAGNCYDQNQYKDYQLFCPYAYRLPKEEGILAKDLAVEYKYLTNTSEWFYIARKTAESVINRNSQYKHAINTYTWNQTSHTKSFSDDILAVTYEDGKWSKPYYDCGGGNIWMLTYTVPFFDFKNGRYFFKGTSGIDIDLRRVDIDQCSLPERSTKLNIFASSNKCKNETTQCVSLAGFGFRRGSYKCVCRKGYYFPDITTKQKYFNGVLLEEEYEKLTLSKPSSYNIKGNFECKKCAEGCDDCVDFSPCIATYDIILRITVLLLTLLVIGFLPMVAIFTYKYNDLKIVKAASPVLLQIIILGAFFIYTTIIVMYPKPNIITCTARYWLREIGFSLTYGALMLKTWRVSQVFKVNSAKTVRITDKQLIKLLVLMVTFVTVILFIRTMVSPPQTIIGRTADNLKTDICPTDWWDHSFSMLEVVFLIWGIRLCVMVRKTPSAFNESRFISIAIYNEFIMSVFLNVSMIFLKYPANPDLQYVIFFCHAQLTVTVLLGLLFGSKALIIYKGEHRTDEASSNKILAPNSKLKLNSSKQKSIEPSYESISDKDNTEIQELQNLKESIENLMVEFAKCGPAFTGHIIKLQAMLSVLNNSCGNNDPQNRSIINNGCILKIMGSQKEESSA